VRITNQAQETDMRARREIGETAFRLFQGGREIGFIRGGTVGFVGFMDADHAAYAGREAHQALLHRRDPARPWMPGRPATHFIVTEGGRQHVADPSGILATLRPPASGLVEEGVWGVDLELLPEEQADVIAVGRARSMWTALLASGAAGRMRQFREGARRPVITLATGRVS
jgi:hypothetical protein